MRQDLINQLTNQLGIQQDQANKVVDTIADYFRQNPDDIKEIASGGWKNKMPGV
ncbi:MAG: hypothetical protein ACRDHF_11350 [Tepidiformaceae bacterium]